MESKLQELERRLSAINGYYDVERVMHSYTQLYSVYDSKGICALFAKRDDSKAEMTWGVYYGYEGIQRCFAFSNPLFTDSHGKEGELHLRPVSVPLLHVAGDGKTAKGAWICTGIDSSKKRDAGGDTDACWTWLHYGVDFINQDGDWKIWHLHEYNVMQSDYFIDWVKAAAYDPYVYNGTTAKEYFALLDPAIPDALPSSVFAYDVGGIYPMDRPIPPLPYESFDPKSAY